MARALVLNATYEPIGVVSARRAVTLHLDGKVDVLADAGERLQSERLSVAVPSVVRLRYYVKVPYQRTAPLSRRAVYVRDDRTCQYCGHRAESIDHVVPRSRGGAHEWTNVVACCRRCNTVKGDRLLSETSMRLHRAPTAPAGDLWVAVAVPSIPESWDPWLDRVAA